MNQDKSYRKGYNDGLNFALILARKYCDNDDLIHKLEREMNPDRSDNLIKLDYGKSYMIYEKTNNIGMKIASRIAIDKNPLILITRDMNTNLKDLKNVKYALISYDQVEGSFNPGELSKLQEFILNNLKEKSVLYIDCLDYFISMNTIQPNILKFISLIKDNILRRKGIFLISINKDSLEEPVVSFLEKEIKNIVSFKRED